LTDAKVLDRHVSYSSPVTRVLLVPGRSPAGPRHWMTLWSQAYPEYMWVRRRETPDTDLDERVTALDAAVKATAEPAILVATSLGCLTVARWAASHEPGPVASALLTVPPDVPEVAEPFLPLPFRSIVVGSRDDEHMEFDRAKVYAAGWGAEFVDAGEVGHLNTASGHGPWPWGEELLATLSGRA
jgi:predicted alpha/beta hydrolase family esterase